MYFSFFYFIPKSGKSIDFVGYFYTYQGMNVFYHIFIWFLSKYIG